MLNLALRNIVRQKAHTAMTLVAIIFGVAGLILAGGWVNDVFVQLAEALIHSHSGHAQVYRQGFYEFGSRSPEKYLIGEPDTIKQRIAKIDGVHDVMARLNFAGLLSNGRSDVPVIGEGVEAAKEAELGTFLTFKAGRTLRDTDKFGIIIGSGVAQALKLVPGDQVTLLANTIEGALSTLDVEVIGIFQSFSNDYDARAVKIPLASAQQLLGRTAANALVVSVNETSATSRIASELAQQLGPAGFEVKTWVELNDFYEKTVALYRRQFGVLQLIVLIMVVLSVANTVNLSVFERLGEFGTMMSLGNRGRSIFRLVITENILLGLIGGGLGVLLGVLLAFVISAIGIPMPPPPNANISYTARIQLAPSTLLMAFTVGLIATAVASLWPAARVSRTPIVDALRSNI